MIKLRQEYFGGIVFDAGDGSTREYNKSAFFILNELAKGAAQNSIVSSVRDFFGCDPARLLDAENLVSEFINNIVNKKFNAKPVLIDETLWLNDPGENNSYLAAPESIHLAVTSRCNQHCPGCYSGSNNADSCSSSDLSQKEIFSLIDSISHMNIFQLSIGGGEPFTREDIFDIIRYADSMDIAVSLTTNGTLIDEDLAVKIAQSPLKQVQVSLDAHNKELHNSQREKDSFDEVLRGIGFLKKSGQRFGVNTLVTKRNVNLVPEIVSFVHGLGAAEQVLLRPKPSKNDPHWLDANNISSAEYRSLSKIIWLLSLSYPLRVDTSLSFVFRDKDPELLKARGIYGCTAGSRLCTVSACGDVFPCSHMNDDVFKAGNIRYDNLKDLWLHSKVFDQFRSLPRTLKGKCSDCKINHFCKGCRLSAFKKGDFYDEDKSCPL
ncbi:MAG: radical SAM protein [bacterium]|nr:radical SAM protein [bacterium]